MHIFRVEIWGTILIVIMQVQLIVSIGFAQHIDTPLEMGAGLRMVSGRALGFSQGYAAGLVNRRVQGYNPWAAIRAARMWSCRGTYIFLNVPIRRFIAA